MTYPNKSDIRGHLTGYAVSMGVWIVTAALLILSASLIAFSGDDPDSMIGTLALVALYVSVFSAGICSAAVSGRITSVIFTSLTIAAIVLLAASFKPEGTEIGNIAITALLYCLVPVVSFAGGAIVLLIKRNRSSKPKRRNRRKR